VYFDDTERSVRYQPVDSEAVEVGQLLRRRDIGSDELELLLGIIYERA